MIQNSPKRLTTKSGWLPWALVGSQGPWLAPSGLGWLSQPGSQEPWLIGSQGPWLPPRGLGWLPGDLVDWLPGPLAGSNGPWLAPRSFGWLAPWALGWLKWAWVGSQELFLAGSQAPWLAPMGLCPNPQVISKGGAEENESRTHFWHLKLGQNDLAAEAAQETMDISVWLILQTSSFL